MLPKGKWKAYINGRQAGLEELAVLTGKTEIKVPGIEPLVLVRTYIKAEVFYTGTGIVVLAAILVGIRIRKNRRRKHECSSNHQ